MNREKCYCMIPVESILIEIGQILMGSVSNVVFARDTFTLACAAPN